MNARRRIFPSPRTALILLVALALLLTACGAGPGESWAGLGADTDDGTVFISNRTSVVALDAATGVARWRYEYDGAQFYAVPTIDNGTIFVGDYSGRLHAISTADGTQRWLYAPERDRLVGPISLEAPDRVIGGVAVSDGMVFYGLGSRNVVAISRDTQDEVWTFKTDHGVWSTPVLVAANVEAGIDQDMLLVASLDQHLYALDPTTGTELWRRNLGGAAPGGLTYDDERHLAFVGTFVSEVLAIDVATNEIVARFGTENWVWGNPALEDDMLYFGDLGGNLYAVRITDDNRLTQVWTRAVAQEAIRATPAITEELVIASSKDKNVYAVNKADGAQRWYKSAEGEALTNLVFVPEDAQAGDAARDLIIVGTTNNDKLVAAFAVASGEPSWQYEE